MVRNCLSLGLLCVVAACAADPPARVTSVQNYNATFTCGGNQTLRAHFMPFKAVLDVQGVSVDMVQQPAADGFLYAGGGHSLRARGAEATWTDDKGAVHHCRDIADQRGNATVR